MKNTLAFSALAAVLLAAGGAAAQGEAPPAVAETPEEPPKPKMNLSVPPPDAPLLRRDYNHEGFYLRFNAGAGFQYASAEAGGVSGDGTDFALGADLLIGGSPSPGMALGGAVLANVGFSSEVGLQYTIGPFFDAFPNSKDGWHLGLMLGAAGTTQQSVFGGGGAIWAGYDLWVAPEWSVGFLVRGGGAYMAGDNQSLGTFTTVAMISIVYN